MDTSFLLLAWGGPPLIFRASARKLIISVQFNKATVIILLSYLRLEHWFNFVEAIL